MILLFILPLWKGFDFFKTMNSEKAFFFASASCQRTISTSLFFPLDFGFLSHFNLCSLTWLLIKPVDSPTKALPNRVLDSSFNEIFGVIKVGNYIHNFG